MPFTYSIHHDLRLIHKKAWGAYSDVDAQSADLAWRAEYALKPEIINFDELQDLSAVTEYSVSIETVRNMASYYAEFRQSVEAPPVRTAYVAPSKIAFGTGRVYQALIELSGIQFAVFENIQDGLDWLGVQSLPDLPVPDSLPKPNITLE